MTITAGVVCAHCGAENLGTRFCENCGRPAGTPDVATTATAAAVVPVSGVASAPVFHYAAAADTGVRRGSRLNVVTLVGYLGYLVIPALGYLALSNASYYSGVQAWYVVLQILTWGLLLISGISATIAGFTSRTTPGRRVGGGMLGILFLLLWLLVFLASFGAYWLAIGQYLTPLVLFLSWAIARPFRGPGYFAILIGIVLTGLTIAIPALPFLQYNYGALSVITLVMNIATVVVTVVVAMAFEKNARPATGFAPSGVVGVPMGQSFGPGYAGRTNTLAVVSLVFGIVGGSLVAVILGHIAKSQIRRTGESGSGMATAGLILGYFWLVAFVIYIAYVLIGLITLYGALGSYGY